MNEWRPCPAIKRIETSNQERFVLLDAEAREKLGLSCGDHVELCAALNRTEIQQQKRFLASVRALPIASETMCMSHLLFQNGVDQRDGLK